MTHPSEEYLLQQIGRELLVNRLVAARLSALGSLPVESMEQVMRMAHRALWEINAADVARDFLSQHYPRLHRRICRNAVERRKALQDPNNLNAMVADALGVLKFGVPIGTIARLIALKGLDALCRGNPFQLTAGETRYNLR